jgi:hypothetical protein
MEPEDRIARWERVTIRFAAFAALVIILAVAICYAGIEGYKLLVQRLLGQ